jgi:Fe-Mn family superoxide dismutase
MRTSPSRRHFLGLTAATAAVHALLPAALAQSTGVPKKEYAIKKLPFDPAKIKGLSEKLLVSHYENNYSGAVKRLNAITAQLASLDVASAPVFVVNGLKREELIATNSMIIHELYFDGLGGEGEPKGALAEAMNKDFGSVVRWKAEFVAMGKALGGGSGWVLLTWSPHDKRLVNIWAADHTHSLANGRPILALDMYEHAYAMDYGARAAGYVDAFMQAIRWDNAASLLERYSKEV